MVERKGSPKQQEYIGLYNKLHKVMTDEAREYFKKVAKSEIMDSHVSATRAERYADGGFRGLLLLYTNELCFVPLSFSYY